MSEATEGISLADVVILRAWRDGSVHAEVPTTRFADDEGVFLTHLDYVWGKAEHRSFKTVCGLSWWNVGISTSGYKEPGAVSCPACREALLALTDKTASD